MSTVAGQSMEAIKDSCLGEESNRRRKSSWYAGTDVNHQGVQGLACFAPSDHQLL